MRHRCLTRTGTGRLRPLALMLVLALTLPVAGCARRDPSPTTAAPPVPPTTISTPTTCAPPATTVPRPPAAPATPVTAPRHRVGTWRALPAPPLPENFYSDSIVWTGRELLLLGLAGPGERPGGSTTLTGAAFNPRTRAWRKLPVLRDTMTGAHEGLVQAVWTGREAVVVGTIGGAYDPATNRWRRITPRAGVNALTIWTGRHVLAWGTECCGGETVYGWQYTPATDTWRRLPAWPLSAPSQAGAWTGREAVVIGAGRSGRSAAAAYNPATSSWRWLPRMPESRFDPSVTWTGSRLMVVGGTTDNYHRPSAGVLAYSPSTNRWTRLASMPTPRADHVAVCTGRRLLVWGGWSAFEPDKMGASRTAPRHGVAYERATGHWTALPKSPLRARWNASAVWTGSQMIIWGGDLVREQPGGSIPAGPNGAVYTP